MAKNETLGIVLEEENSNLNYIIKMIKSKNEY